VSFRELWTGDRRSETVGIVKLTGCSYFSMYKGRDRLGIILEFGFMIRSAPMRRERFC